MATSTKQRATAAKETMEILFEMSKILNTGLDMETLATVVRLCESGINPEALAMVVTELRKEAAAVKIYAYMNIHGVRMIQESLPDRSKKK